MTTYDDLLAEAGGLKRGPKRAFSKDVARDRRAEQARRSSRAQARARTILTNRHADEYRELYRLMIDEVNAERGPLPGDEKS